MTETQPHLYHVRGSADRLSLGAANALAEQWSQHGGQIVIYRRRRILWIGRVVVATFGGRPR